MDGEGTVQGVPYYSKNGTTFFGAPGQSPPASPPAATADAAPAAATVASAAAPVASALPLLPDEINNNDTKQH